MKVAHRARPGGPRSGRAARATPTRRSVVVGRRRRSRSSRRRARARAGARSSAAAVRSSEHGHELGRHDAAGGVLGVAQQLLDLLGLVVLHQGQDLVAGGPRTGRRRGRRRRRGSSPRGCRRRAPGSRSSRTSTCVSGSISSMASAAASSSRDGQDAGPVARRELVDDRGQVGRVQLAQARVGHAQADRRDRRLDRVHVLPVDVALRQRQAQVAGDGPIRPFDAQPAQQAGRAHVHRHQVQRALDARRGAGR